MTAPFARAPVPALPSPPSPSSSSSPFSPSESNTRAETESSGGRAVPVVRVPLRIALCPFPVSAAIGSNLAAIEGLAREAAAQRARVAVFAEGALTGYLGEHVEDAARLDLDAVRAAHERLGRLARETAMALVVGTVHATPAARYNSLLAFGPDGAEAARYDKRHLTSQDRRYFAASDAPPTFLDLDGWRLGLLLCFDVRFPLWAHESVRGGADVLVYAFNMCGRAGVWKRPAMEAAVRTRAAENHVFAVAVNDARPAPQVPALAVDRGGRTLVRAHPVRPTVLVAELDPAKSFRIGEEIRADQPLDYPLAARWASER